jgi:hypothetical protein
VFFFSPTTSHHRHFFDHDFDDIHGKGHPWHNGNFTGSIAPSTGLNALHEARGGFGGNRVLSTGEIRRGGWLFGSGSPGVERSRSSGMLFSPGRSGESFRIGEFGAGRIRGENHFGGLGGMHWGSGAGHYNVGPIGGSHWSGNLGSGHFGGANLGRFSGGVGHFGGGHFDGGHFGGGHGGGGHR